MIDVVHERRHLHSAPELGFLEFRTATRVVETLRGLGFTVQQGRVVMIPEVRMGVPDDVDDHWNAALQDGCDPEVLGPMRGGLTGVVATLEGNGPGPTVALRVDMDALPISESISAGHKPHDSGFASTTRGVMHACGHDGHVAIALALAERLSSRTFEGTLKLIFQPAEEGLRGGKAMAAAGVVDDVDDLLCLHLGQGLQVGEVAGGMTRSLASSKLQFTFTGLAAHAGISPERGRSALLAACNCVLALQVVVQNGSGLARLNVGELVSRGASNIVPALATMVLEVRAEHTDQWLDILSRTRALVEGISASYGVEVEMLVRGEAPSVICDLSLVDEVVSAASKTIGVNRVLAEHFDGGSEDASWLIDRVREHGGRGTYVIVGASQVAGHHESEFDIDERCLSLGVDVMENSFRALLVHRDSDESR